MNILEIGIEQGNIQKLIELICKKLRKGKSVECIADEVEEEYDLVAQICKLAAKYAPEYNQNNE